MTKQLSIYLDVCCLNRPFDDWSQARVRLEAEAILEIITRCQEGEWRLVSSTALESEVAQTPNPTRVQQVMISLSFAKINLSVTAETRQRAIQLTTLGFKAFDALHIACAEDANVDVMLTTDDRLLRKTILNKDVLKVRVTNPIIWFMEMTTAPGEEK